NPSARGVKSWLFGDEWLPIDGSGIRGSSTKRCPCRGTYLYCKGSGKGDCGGWVGRSNRKTPATSAFSPTFGVLGAINAMKYSAPSFPSNWTIFKFLLGCSCTVTVGLMRWIWPPMRKFKYSSQRLSELLIVGNTT